MPEPKEFSPSAVREACRRAACRIERGELRGKTVAGLLRKIGQPLNTSADDPALLDWLRESMPRDVRDELQDIL